MFLYLIHDHHLFSDSFHEIILIVQNSFHFHCVFPSFLFTVYRSFPFIVLFVFSSYINLIFPVCYSACISLCLHTPISWYYFSFLSCFSFFSFDPFFFQLFFLYCSTFSSPSISFWFYIMPIAFLASLFPYVRILFLFGYSHTLIYSAFIPTLSTWRQRLTFSFLFLLYHHKLTEIFCFIGVL